MYVCACMHTVRACTVNSGCSPSSPVLASWMLIWEWTTVPVPVAPGGLSGQVGWPCCSRPIGVTPLEYSSASWSPWTLLSEFTLTVPLEYSLWPASVSKIPLANPLFSSSLGQRNRPQWGSWSWMRDMCPLRHIPWGQAKTDWAHHFSGWTLVSRHFFFFNLKIY